MRWRVACMVLCVLFTAARLRAALPQTPGYHELKWTGTVDGPLSMNYILFLPHDYNPASTTGYPISFFMGGSGNAGDEITGAWAGCPLEKLKSDPRLEKTYPGIMVVAQSPPRGIHWNQPRMGRAGIQLLDTVMHEVRVDKNRVSILGFSEGGQGCWFVASEDPGRWAVMLPCASKAFSPDWPGKLSHVPMWAIVGVKDNYCVDASQKLVDQLRAQGDHVLFTILPDIDHWCWFYYYTNAQYYEWIFDHHRPVPGDRVLGVSEIPKAPGRYLQEFDTTVAGQAIHISYTVTLPRGYTALGQSHPLLMSLSELGTIGDYVNGWCLHGPDLQLERKGHENLRASFPFVLITPMCPVQLKYWTDQTVYWAIRNGGSTAYTGPQSQWDATVAQALKALMDDVCKKYNVDRSRAYATGMNQGAVALPLLSQADPHRYAAMAGVTDDPQFAPAAQEGLRIVTTTPADPIGCYAQDEFYAWLLQHRSH